jgi:RNA polymerase sigma-70 factor, ECF subfamily
MKMAADARLSAIGYRLSAIFASPRPRAISEGLLVPDNTSDTVSSAAEQDCRQMVRGLIARYRWSLIGEDELVAFGLGELADGVQPASLEHHTISHYSLLLYAACRQSDDLERQSQAYRDLHAYLYRVACQRRPDLADDVTQRALLLIYQQIERCREPKAFLQFALFKLRHAYQQEQPNQAAPPLDIETVELADARAPQLTILVAQEGLRQLLLALRDLPESQRQVISMKFIEGLSDEEIGQRLGLSAGNVRVIRFRGLQRLRNDPRLRSYFAEVADPESL